MVACLRGMTQPNVVPQVHVRCHCDPSKHRDCLTALARSFQLRGAVRCTFGAFGEQAHLDFLDNAVWTLHRLGIFESSPAFRVPELNINSRQSPDETSFDRSF